MKKILVLCLIIAVGLGVTGATCLQNVQDKVCNPPADVIAVVNAAAPLVAIAINIAVPGSAVYVNAVSVMATVTAIQGGACVSMTQLNALIVWLQSDEAKSLQAKAMVKAEPTKAVALDPAPLIAWRDSVK
jgi:amino acid transporter